MIRLLCAAALAFSPTLAFTQQAAALPTSMTETYGAWTVRCVTPEDADVGRQCEMAQELSRAQDGPRLLLTSLRIVEGNAQLVLVTPFGLLLSEGIQMNVAEGQVAQIAFRTCLPAGCIGRTELSAETIARIQRGNTVQFDMRTTGDEPFAIELSLQGFTAAWVRLQDLAGT